MAPNMSAGTRGRGAGGEADDLMYLYLCSKSSLLKKKKKKKNYFLLVFPINLPAFLVLQQIIKRICRVRVAHPSAQGHSAQDLFETPLTFPDSFVFKGCFPRNSIWKSLLNKPISALQKSNEKFYWRSFSPNLENSVISCSLCPKQLHPAHLPQPISIHKYQI